MDIDVVFRFVGVLGFVGWEATEDCVVQAPLEMEGHAETSHCDVAGIGEADEVGVARDEEAEGSLPDGWWGIGEEGLEVGDIMGCGCIDVDRPVGAPGLPQVLAEGGYGFARACVLANVTTETELQVDGQVVSEGQDLC